MVQQNEMIYDADKTSDNGRGGADERRRVKAEAALTRREMIKLTAGAAVAAPVIGLSQARAAVKTFAASDPAPEDKALLFFTREEFQLVDELTELIIPADDHSPGARAAEVAAYIDRRLAESFEEEPRKLWRVGLKMIDTLSQETYGSTFLQAGPEQRVALLTRISQNEMNPQKPEETFFRELKARTARAYYTSKIGIHTEMEYKGNSYLKEFVGYDAT
ncbi:MAG: gluconate 2-dehydrogenase subunit 3 family protein [Blastocatellia bacterium]